MHAHHIRLPPLCGPLHHVGLFSLCIFPLVLSAISLNAFLLLPTFSHTSACLLTSFFLLTPSDLQASSQIASLLQAGCPTDDNKEMVYHLVGFSKGE